MTIFKLLKDKPVQEKSGQIQKVSSPVFSLLSNVGRSGEIVQKSTIFPLLMKEGIIQRSSLINTPSFSEQSILELLIEYVGYNSSTVLKIDHNTIAAGVVKYHARTYNGDAETLGQVYYAETGKSGNTSGKIDSNVEKNIKNRKEIGHPEQKILYSMVKEIDCSKLVGQNDYVKNTKIAYHSVSLYLLSTQGLCSTCKLACTETLRKLKGIINEFVIYYGHQDLSLNYGWQEDKKNGSYYRHQRYPGLKKTINKLFEK